MIQRACAWRYSAHPRTQSLRSVWRAMGLIFLAVTRSTRDAIKKKTKLTKSGELWGRECIQLCPLRMFSPFHQLVLMFPFLYYIIDYILPFL